MKKAIPTIIILLLLAVIGFLMFSYYQLNNSFVSLLEAQEECCFYDDNEEYYYDEEYYDEEYYDEEYEPIGLNAEFYSMIDVYPNKNINNLFPKFLRDVLGLESEEHWKKESGISYHKRNYHDFSSYFNWFFDQPEYLDKETVASEATGFFWSNYFQNFDRSSDNISSMFDEHKSIVYATINKEMYHSLDFDTYVNTLIEVYDQLVLDHYNDHFSNLANDEPEYLSYDDFDALVVPDIVDEWYRYDDEYYMENDVFWLYSFWYRRYKEENIDATYKILKELQAQYAN